MYIKFEVINFSNIIYNVDIKHDTSLDINLLYLLYYI